MRLPLALVVLALSLAACGPTPAGTSAVGAGRIAGHATAGPVCPVERIPPDPACAPRPVAGAHVVARRADGSQAAETVSDPAGAFALDVPAGDYTVTADPVEGFMSAPAPMAATVREAATTTVDLAYDTGIR